MNQTSRGICLALVCCWAAFGLPTQAAEETKAEKKEANKPNVQQLIEQLGHDEYLQRQRAEAGLLELGAQAFSDLQAAVKNADLEVATRAKYLLTQINIEWTRPTDPPAVQAIMGRYGELSLQLKLRKVRELSQLKDEQGFAALCRIAMFDNTSTVVARYAALEILEKGMLPTARVQPAIAALQQELGEAPEVPASWIALYIEQLQSDKQVDPRWVTLIDEELGLLEEGSSETSQFLATALLTAYLDLSDQLSDDVAMLAGLQRRIDFTGERNSELSDRLIQAIEWLVKRNQWGALSMLEDSYAGAIKSSRLVLYHLALARESESRADAAQKLADEALALSGNDLTERNECASLIAEQGHHDWAEREWFAVVDSAKATDVESLLARISLAMTRISDRLEHKQAADLLAESIDAIEGDPATLQYYRTQYYQSPNRRNSKQPLLTILQQAQANRDFFLAAHYASVGEHEKERELLERAFELEPANPDIIIAMFHSKEADEEYREKVNTRLTSVRMQLDKDINDFKRKVKRTSRELNYYLSHKYNHWAWLVSNTEGDFDKAVKYSQHSLELQPDTPSYLDTLGRCHYAAGNLDEAIEAQKKAVAQQPHMMVMQRQLQMFEDELSKRESN